MQEIIIHKAREHNLKNVDLVLPRNKMIVFTGISGSGKSSLAFDTIYAEGQRRYMESLSSYARQFLGQMQKPNVEEIEGLSPAISIDQKTRSHNPRSIVGTVTEIYDYLRLLYARIGVAFCPNDGTKIEKQTIDQIVETIFTEGTEKEIITIFSPIVRGRKGEYHQQLYDLYQDGFSQIKVNGKIKSLSEKIVISRYKKHHLDLVVDQIILTKNPDREIRTRLSQSLETALARSKGIAKVFFENQKKEHIFSTEFSCSNCGFAYEEITPRLFSFNSPYGACEACGGLGIRREIDPDLVIPDKNRTIVEGAILPWNFKNSRYYNALIRAVAAHYSIDLETPINKLVHQDLEILLYGSGKERIKVRFYHRSSPVTFYINFEGIIRNLERRYQQTNSPKIREEIEQYMASNPCHVCEGKRLKKEVLTIKINHKNISQLIEIPINELYMFFDKLALSSREAIISERILKEIRARLNFLKDVGLGYLTLGRSAASLSGGESQRIRLASQIGSGLTGVLYVLDEPTIGLHQRDNRKLVETLIKMRDLGNTIIVVEHDEQTIRSSDFLVDIGPGAGRNGGEVVVADWLPEALKNNNSLTVRYLNGLEKIESPARRRKIDNKKFLQIWGAAEHNLKNINLSIPLGVFVCVTGVSGSGKSTLVNDILYKSAAKKFLLSHEKPGKVRQIEGWQNLERCYLIDQSPIGRTPRSNPVTYVGVFTAIRELFAMSTYAREKGYSPGRFSFNVSGGRCEACAGEGQNKIEMHFLPDVYVPCEVCKERRFNNETLEVKFKDKNIADILEMTIDEAVEFFAHHPSVLEKLKTLQDVGLGYLQLGQSAPTLSGGEAQRVKLAAHLSKKTGGKTLYILDEPTTGLHFDDVKKLLKILNRLVESGNSILVIEHNLDVIKMADWIIDLGPEGGEEGGMLVAEGAPEEIVKIDYSYTGQILKEYFNAHQNS